MDITEALALPSGGERGYHTLEERGIESSSLALVEGEIVAITNATSEVPVIGVEYNASGYAVLLWDASTGTAVAGNVDPITPEDVLGLLSRMGNDGANRVEAHIIGGMDHSVTSLFAMDNNLPGILHALEEAGVELKT